MIETAASKSCRDGARSPYKRAECHNRAETSAEWRRYNIFTWPNRVCLDAPMVAITWLSLFARNFGIPIARGGTAALFLTAWFIYLADRFGDNLSLGKTVPTSLRQRFCRNHRTGWLITLPLVGAADVFVIFAQVDLQTRAIGAVVGAFAFAYLWVNQLAPVVWRRLPLKEICIGSFFAAGTIVPLVHGLTRAIVPAWLLFACLCSINCICIAVWERDLDLAQGRLSIATTFPIVHRLLLPGAIVLCLTSCVVGVYEVALSAALLAILHIFRNNLQTDLRAALADLVLLTPIATLIKGLLS